MLRVLPTRVQMFFAYAAGFTMKYDIVAWVPSYLVKRANRLLVECVNTEKTLEVGMNDRITKPIDVGKFREVLVRVISTT